ncbi:N-acetyltransferase [Microbacterium sp. MYb62]|uniref:N-acetyltransferase n=1 Tax=Microbacterium sp. MYb62 TaxID=1848690 RepID=UPI000CFBEE2C|nr:N-acetyltransferase [Microbacterium sp. MYb62]PRB14130.1 N-acetyltransferase [Microbacterium sp. MYb62]
MNTVPRARLFRRDDRDQLTDLVNAHLSSVIPGARVSVNAVLSSLERQPDEYIVDPWVVERATIVVEQGERIVAAAHLQRFAEHPRVSDDYRGAGLIQWALSVPGDDGGDPAAETLMRACLAQLRAWAVTTAYADGQLPFPGVYGIPASWPHVRRSLEGAGFSHDGPTEVVLLATTSGLASIADPPAASDVASTRELGAHGIRFIATRDGETAGYVEVDLTVNRAERHSAGPRFAELSDWEADDADVLVRLFGDLHEWLTSSDVARLIVAVDPADADECEQLFGLGFREVTSTTRGWRRQL